MITVRGAIVRTAVALAVQVRRRLGASMTQRKSRFANFLGRTDRLMVDTARVLRRKLRPLVYRVNPRRVYVDRRRTFRHAQSS